MKILILGESGFIGKYISTHLQKRGFEVVSFQQKIDFMNLPLHQEMVKIFDEVDIVINAVGIILERADFF